MKRNWNRGAVFVYMVILTSIFASCEGEGLYADNNRISEALKLLDNEQNAAGRDLLLAHLKEKPGDAQALYYMGLSHHSEDSFTRAVAYYTKALEAEPTRASFIRNRGICLVALQQPNLAKADFEALEAMDSLFSTDKYYLARCYMANADQEMAYNTILEGMEMDTAGIFRNLFMEFVYDNFSEKYRETRYYQDAGLKVVYSFDADSVRDGIWKSFYPSGKLFEEGRYLKGVKDGKETAFFESGAKKAITLYNKGNLHGVRKTFYKSGAKFSEVNYRNNVREDWAVSWYETGKPKASYYFSQGKKDSVHTRWFADGKLAVQFRFSNDVENGIAYAWNPEQETYMELLFDQSILVDEKPIPELPAGMTGFPKP